MADFYKYYPFLKQFEGGYVNDPDDSGGETYRGIARKHNPNWDGWEIVDDWKAKNGIPKYNFIIPIEYLDKLCADYSKSHYWDKMYLDQINNQSVAEMIGDYGYNSGTRLSMGTVQELIGHPKTMIFNSNDIAQINLVDQEKLFTDLQNRRIKTITESKKIHPKYKTGLINRAKAIQFNQ